MPSPRTLRIRLAYDGTGFHGWQVQPDRRTVQGELMRALATLLGGPVKVAGAGRTDAGVHALGQVASLTTDRTIPAVALRRGLNSLLPDDIRVSRVSEAPEGFHARFSARSRRYLYRIARRPGPIRSRYAWVAPRAPGADRLNRAGAPLLGRHDFASFTSGEGLLGDTRCTIEALEWRETGSRLALSLTADRFLYRMVRSIVGVLVGLARTGRLEPEVVAALLDPGAARSPLPPAPAAGLFLAGVDYPPDDQIVTWGPPAAGVE